MPAIKKISKEAIIDAAVDVLREGGAAAINARSVAKKLGCSTQPIYLSFQNMDDLKTAMTQRAIALHTQHVRNSNSDTQYSCYGMGFVKFAAGSGICSAGSIWTGSSSAPIGMACCCRRSSRPW